MTCVGIIHIRIHDGAIKPTRMIHGRRKKLLFVRGVARHYSGYGLRDVLSGATRFEMIAVHPLIVDVVVGRGRGRGFIFGVDNVGQRIVC